LCQSLGNSSLANNVVQAKSYLLQQVVSSKRYQYYDMREMQ